MPLLGVDVNSESAVLVVADGAGAPSPGAVRVVKPADDADAVARVSELLERIVQHLRELQIEHVVLTDTDLSRARPTSVRARAQIETVFLLAAAKVGVGVEVVHQRKVGIHLGLPATANKDAIRVKVTEVVGEAALMDEPVRRARALGAVWVSAGVEGAA